MWEIKFDKEFAKKMRKYHKEQKRLHDKYIKRFFGGGKDTHKFSKIAR